MKLLKNTLILIKWYEQSLGLIQGRDDDEKMTFNKDWTFDD